MFSPSTKPMSLKPWRNAAKRWVESSGDRPLMNPMTGFACCALSGSDRADTTAARSVMNSRRFIRAPSQGHPERAPLSAPSNANSPPDRAGLPLHPGVSQPARCEASLPLVTEPNVEAYAFDVLAELYICTPIAEPA